MHVYVICMFITITKRDMNTHCSYMYIIFLPLIRFQVKWLSLLHHVQNDREGTWEQCDHDMPLAEAPTDRNGKVLPRFLPDEPVTEALRRVTVNQKWLESLKYYVHFSACL